MTFDPALLDAASAGLYLDLSETDLTKAWQRSQSFSSSSSRWNAYLNQVCLNSVLNWIREEYAPEANVWLNATLPSIWEVVNGAAITVDTTRFVLVPTETIDLSELRVPQEWVDIPSWAGDYYLGVQVDPDQGLVKIWGYATGEQLKQKASYDAQDRTYCLDEDDLIQDISVLWVARQLCQSERTKTENSPLPSIPLAQVENLITRLGNPDLINPRLAVPFKLWGALLEHGGWRQRLYQSRMGYPEQWSILQWLQSGVSEAAKQFGWGQAQQQMGSSRGSTKFPAEFLSRQLMIAGQNYELRVIPKGNADQRIWRFELRNGQGSSRIPGGFKLRLLTEDLQAFEGNEDVAVNAVEHLYVDVVLSPGEGLVWEVEPLPDNCDQEILRF